MSTPAGCGVGFPCSCGTTEPVVPTRRYSWPLLLNGPDSLRSEKETRWWPQRVQRTVNRFAIEGSVIARGTGCLARQRVGRYQAWIPDLTTGAGKRSALGLRGDGLRFTDTIERLACAAHAVEDELAEAEDPAEESLLDLYSLDPVQEDLQVPPAD